MSRRKTAQSGPVKKAEPVSKRRWVIVKSDGNIALGSENGITLEDRARRISDGLVIETSVQLWHEYHGLPDPDLEAEE